MKKLMIGNEAVARGAWEAGVRVVCSYPGTPSTEITEFCAKYPEMNCQWAPNEKVAVETSFGACMAGARALSCMKHVGVNVAADPLFTAAYTGVNAGLVIAAADDPFMHSSQNEQDTRMVARSAHIPVLEPADSQECLEYTKLAYELSYVREALPDASVLKLGLSYPMPEKLIREFAAQVDELVVVEELEPVFERDIRNMGIKVSGKDKTGLQGELSAAKIRQLFGDGAPAPTEAALPGRPPALCPGCPHRATFFAMKKLGLTVFGDIGCYTLSALPPIGMMDSTLCMGASVGMAFGAEKARGKEFSKKTVAVLGDSTFIHSGVTPLIDAVYGGASTTTVILDNRITGMTGHQQNPASGKNILGEPAPQLNLEALCEAIGATVRVCDPHDLKEFTKILKEETQADHVSVVIARRPCALLDKRKKEPCHIENCHNCGACMKLGCPALIKTDKGVVIDHTLCVGCGLCKQVCPFGAIQGGEE